MPPLTEEEINRIDPYKWFTVRDAASALGVSNNLVRKFIQQGEMKGYKIGGKIWIKGEEVIKQMKEYKPNLKNNNLMKFLEKERGKNDH